MGTWHNVRVREDLYELIRLRAAEERRSVASMTDVLLIGVLEQEPNTSASSDGRGSVRRLPGENGRGAGVGRSVEPASVPARAPVAQRIEGQTTVDDMLASCPNCAGAFILEVDTGRMLCEDCGHTREPS